MKQEIVEAFDQVAMPESCETRIRKSLSKNRRAAGSTARRMTAVLAGFAGVLTVLLAFSPEVRAMAEAWVVRYIFPESGITIYEETEESGETVRIMAVDTENPAFAQMRDGRLYFTGNGQNADITDQITPEKPYIYTYVDDYGLTHYMVVGYSDSLENFGIYEFLREEKAGQKEWEGWTNGYGRNFLDPKTETRYPWVDIVWQSLNVPWPLPGE